MGAQRNVLTWVIRWITAGPPPEPGAFDDRPFHRRFTDRLRHTRYRRLAKLRESYYEVKPALDVLLEEARAKPAERRPKSSQQASQSDLPPVDQSSKRRQQAGERSGRLSNGDVINRSMGRMLIASASNAFQAASMGSLVTAVQVAANTMTVGIASAALATFGIGRMRSTMFLRSRQTTANLGRNTELSLIRKMFGKAEDLTHEYYETGNSPHKDIAPVFGSLVNAARGAWSIAACAVQIASSVVLLGIAAPLAGVSLLTGSGLIAWLAKRKATETRQLNQSEYDNMKTAKALTLELDQRHISARLNDGSFDDQLVAFEKAADRIVEDAESNDEIVVKLSKLQAAVFIANSLFTIVLSGFLPNPWMSGLVHSHALMQLAVPAAAVVMVNMSMVLLEAVPENLRLIGAGMTTLREASRFLTKPQRQYGSRELSHIDTIELEGISHPSRGLKDVSLSIERGQSLMIEGDEGCGKTSLVEVLMGNIEPMSGHVFLNGFPLGEYRRRALNERIALIEQGTNVIVEGTAREFILRNVVIGKPDEDKLLREIDEVVRVSPFLTSHAKNGADPRAWTDVELPPGLSGGQRKRLLIARKMAELASGKDVLVMDESLEGLSQQGTLHLMSKLTKWMRHHDKSLVCVMHNAIASHLFDRIAVMSHGRVKAVASHEALMAVAALNEIAPDYVACRPTELKPPADIPSAQIQLWLKIAEEVVEDRQFRIDDRFAAADSHAERVKAGAASYRHAMEGVLKGLEKGTSLRTLDRHTIRRLRAELLRGIDDSPLTAADVPWPPSESQVEPNGGSTSTSRSRSSGSTKAADTQPPESSRLLE